MSHLTIMTRNEKKLQNDYNLFNKETVVKQSTQFLNGERNEPNDPCLKSE